MAKELITKRYKVVRPSYVNGTLHEAGAEVEYAGEVHDNLKLIGEAPPKDVTQPPSPAVYASKHKGAGVFGVVKPDGEFIADFSGSKDEAEAKAAELQGEADKALAESKNLPDA